MDYQVVLSPKAIEDLEAIVRYIAANNPETARKLGRRLLEKTRELGRYPLRGQKVPEIDNLDVRQLILRPYRIIYRVEENLKRVSVARFWHASQENLQL